MSVEAQRSEEREWRYVGQVGRLEVDGDHAVHKIRCVAGSSEVLPARKGVHNPRTSAGSREAAVMPDERRV
jgi:hypothetical protein